VKAKLPSIYAKLPSIYDEVPKEDMNVLMPKVLKALKGRQMSIADLAVATKQMIITSYASVQLREAILRLIDDGKIKCTDDRKFQRTKDILIKPRKNCGTCRGSGLQFFADSFDHDNGTPCPSCEKWAKSKGAKLITP
jgi:hypothetical protein